MKFPKPYTLKQISAIIKCKFEGDEAHLITGMNEINKVEVGDIVFVDHPKYYQKALDSNATTILINEKVNVPKRKAIIISKDPFRDFNKLTKHFSKQVYSLQFISNSAKVGEDTILMPGVFLGNNVQVGKNCILHPHVVIYDNCRVGNNVIIHANSVIGADAFYYKKRQTGHDKLFSSGRVVIHDDVEIGALCTIDRGVSGDTIIGKGTKIDNHVQIGHDTVVGKNCLFAAHVGIAGAVVIEDDVTLWGQVGIPSKLRIAKGTVLLGQSAPAKDTEAGKKYLGSPAEEAGQKMRELALLKKLPDLFKEKK